MTGFVVPVRTRSRASGRTSSRPRSRRGAGSSATRMVQFMLLCSLVLNPLPDEVVARVEEYAAELGDRRSDAAGRRALLARQPRARARRLPAQRLHGDVGSARRRPRCTRRASSPTRGRSASSIPSSAQTLGGAPRSARRHARSRASRSSTTRAASASRARPGSAPPLLAQHDWVHVLDRLRVDGRVRDRGVRVHLARQRRSARVLVARHDRQLVRDRLRRERAWACSSTTAGICRIEGMAVRLADAMRRGALCGAHAGGPDLLRRDWFADAAARSPTCGPSSASSPSRSTRSTSGSVTAWEPGGISPYQYECGRRAAEAAGREYDSYGASPAPPD